MMNLRSDMSALMLFAFLILLISSTQAKKIFCYYSSFAQKRHGVGNFLPEDINPHLCTHLIYAFVDITPDGRDLAPFNRNDLGPNGLYARTMALKEKNPALKVLLAVGGWQIGSAPFVPMISSDSNRVEWIENVVSYLRQNGFDGFDVDWEFPATRGSPPEDKYRFTELMKGLYEAFARESAETGREKLLLTLATASGTYYIDQSYEPSEIIKYLDYMLLMTYNYHGQWEKKTGHHSGLYRHPNDPTSGEKSQLYQQWSIDYWLNVGMPKDRLVVGIPTYGMSFTLADSSNHDVHAPVTGGGRMGDFTRETGIMAFYEICMNLQNKGWDSVWIEEQAAPYAYAGDQWVGYEDQKSISYKAENILTRDLAGAFVWSVEMDDFKGTCGEGQYPLLSSINKLIGGVDINSAASSRGEPRKEPTGDSNPRHDEAKEIQKDTPKLENEVEGNGKGKEMRLKKIKILQKQKDNQNSAVDTPVTNVLNGQVPANNNPERLFVSWWKSPDTRKNVWRPWSKDSPIPERKIANTEKQAWNQVQNRADVDGQPSDPQIHNPQQLKTISQNENSNMVNSLGSPLQAKDTQMTTFPLNAAAASNGNICRMTGAGTFASPDSCDHFIICLSGDWLDFAPHKMACPPGTKFDSKLKICNFASQVECNN